MHRNFSFTKLTYFRACALLVVFFVPAMFVSAATLGFSPGNTSVSEGDIVSMGVVVNTEGSSINNADATINFPADLLEVISIGKTGSVFSLWVEEPAFSNGAGTITFNGGVPNPGYTGSRGTLATIVFRAKKAGTATIIPLSASVRANDGVGTDILSSKSSRTIIISKANVPIPPVQSGLPKIPTIISSSHPVSSEWYSNPTATFSWSIPAGVSSIQTLFNKSPGSTPTIPYDSSVTQKTIANIADGVHYYHLRYINSAGSGPVAHFKIQVDTQSPSSFSPSVRIEGNRVFVVLDAKDSLSGIAHYTVAIGSTEITVEPTALVNNEYQLPIRNAGNQSIVVSAIDRAGNSTDQITLSYESPNISAPSIDLFPREIEKGETVKVIGQSEYPNAQAYVYIEHGGKIIGEYSAQTNEDGSFSIDSEAIETKGKIFVWSELVFPGSVKSPQSDKQTLIVSDTQLNKFGFEIVTVLLWLLIIIILLLLILISSYVGWHKYFGLKRKMDAEVDKVIEDVHKTFSLFKEELGDKLEELEAVKQERTLNKKEQKIFKQLQSNIDTIDEFIEKKLKKMK